MLTNGQLIQTVATTDRGLHYGDGLFETIAQVDGQLQYWPEHFERLQKSAARLGMQCPPEQAWLDDIASLKPEPTCVIKLMLTRGQGQRGYAVDASHIPTRLAFKSEYPTVKAWQDQGMDVILCNTPVSINPALAGMKHLNRLDNVLAATEVKTAGADEGIMCDPHGNVICGTRSNVFMVEGDALITPNLDKAGIAGVMRAQVIQKANALGWQVQENQVSLHNLTSANSVFVTNSVIGLCPVKTVAGHTFMIGPRIRALQEALPL
jgi:4-amino-4-deoxychorismate lyase